MKKITKTVSINEINTTWWLVDAEDKVLGRIASEVAQILRGKHRPNYSPNIYMGDAVVVINSDKIRLTGDKINSKKYFRHSGYPGGAKITKLSDLMKHNSDKVLTDAIIGMLPKNKLGREISRHLRVYRDNNHDLGAQKPTQWSSN